MGIKHFLKTVIGVGKDPPPAEVRPFTSKEAVEAEKESAWAQTFTTYPGPLAQHFGRGPVVEIGLKEDLSTGLRDWALAHERGHEAFIRDVPSRSGERLEWWENLDIQDVDERELIEELVADYYAFSSGTSLPADVKYLDRRVKDDYPDIDPRRFRQLKSIAWKIVKSLPRERL